MATDLLSQFAQQYGNTANWNALRGGSDPLIQQFSQQYGADSNWNAFRPSGAAAAPQGQQQPLSNAPATLPQQPQQQGGASSGDLISQMAKQYGGTPNWNALRGSTDPLAQQFAQQYGADSNWNALRPSSVASATSGGVAPGNRAGDRAGQAPQANPNFNFSWDNVKQSLQLPATNYDEYVKQLVTAGSSPEDAKTHADQVFDQILQGAVQSANANAYGFTKHDNVDYWRDMFRKDPGYTWDRLIGKGAGSADAARYGPWAGGDPNAEGGGGGGGGNNATKFTNGDPLKSPLLAPWDTPFNYSNFSSVSYKPPDPFKPPTAEDMQTDPGYLSRLHEAQKAIERSASARGTLGTGGTLKDLTQFSQDYAANEFQDLYSRRLNEYLTAYNANLTDFKTLYGTDLSNWLTNYNKALGEYQQSYNIFENNQAKQFNRLASLAGLGQTAAGTLGGFGQNFGNNAGSILLQGAAGIGDYYTQAANARASAQAANSRYFGGLFGDLSNIFG